MIRLKTKFDVRKDETPVKLMVINSCTYEHIVAIAYLVKNIKDNDETITKKELIKNVEDLMKIIGGEK